MVGSWAPDPTRRNLHRWWEGRWDAKVGALGLVVSDPLPPDADYPAPSDARPSRKERVRRFATEQFLGRTPGPPLWDRYKGHEMIITPYPCTVFAGTDAYASLLVLTEADLFINRGEQPLLGIPRARVHGCTLEEWNAAGFEYGWKFATGFLHGGGHVAATCALKLSVESVDGAVDLLLRVAGAVPQVRHTFAPLGLTAQADAEATSRDPIDELRRLAELRDQGIITAAEFEAKKAEKLKEL